MQTKFILPCLLSTLFFLNSLSSSAQNRKTIETTTDILMFITPVAGFAGSLAIGDYQGTKQIIFSGATNLAMTYALKYVIRTIAIIMLFLLPIPPFLFRELPLYKDATDGNSAYRLIYSPPMSVGDGRMPKNTIGGMSSEEQPSEQPAAISSPVRLPENIISLSRQQF